MLTEERLAQIASWISPDPDFYLLCTEREATDAIKDLLADRKRLETPVADGKRLWLWKNGPHEFWAFDNPFPTFDGGDPQTLGEPVGYAILKPSKNGRPDVSDEEVIKRIAATREMKP